MSPARPRRRRDRGGFLLTETLASFTLSAFVLLGLVAGATMLVHAVDRSATQVQNADDLDRALDALTRDVAAIKRARWSGEEPQGFVFRGGPSSLLFAEGAGAAAPWTAVALRETMVGDRPVLTRSEAPLPPDARSFADLRFGRARPLPTGAARLRFAYAPARRAGVPVPARLDTWPSGATLPAAVIVEAVDARSGRLLASNRLPLHADAEIGCIVSRGTGSGGDGKDGAAGGKQPAGAGGNPAAGGAVWPPPSGLDALTPSAGTAATPLPPAVAAPQREPEPDFCGRADKDDKPDGSGPRPPSGPARTAAAP